MRWSKLYRKLVYPFDDKKYQRHFLHSEVVICYWITDLSLNFKLKRQTSELDGSNKLRSSLFNMSCYVYKYIVVADNSVFDFIRRVISVFNSKLSLY